MPTNTVLYDPARMYIGDGTVDWDTDTIKVALLSSSYNPRPGASAWIAASNYAVGTVIVVAGRYYEAFATGTSSGVSPLFNATYGATTTDNDIVWFCHGYAPPSTHGVFADVSAAELPTAGGYTAGGATLSGKAVTQVLRSAVFSASPASWPAATFFARYAVIYKSGTANARVNPLLAYVLLDSLNTDVSVPNGADFSLRWASAGVFALN